MSCICKFELKYEIGYLSFYLLIWLWQFLVAACRIFCCGTWTLEQADSVVVVGGLCCSAAYGMLVPWPGIKPTSPALQGGFLTTGPPGRSLGTYFEYPSMEFNSSSCLQEAKSKQETVFDTFHRELMRPLHFLGVKLKWFVCIHFFSFAIYHINSLKIPRAETCHLLWP